LAAESKPAALVLAPETPYPIAGGGALRTASLLHHLARRYDVDLVVFRQPDADDPRAHLPKGLARRVYVLELARNGRSFWARACRNAVRVARPVPPLVDRFSGFGARLQELLAGAQYEVGVIEHFWCAPYWQQISGMCRRTVLDLHNIESVLHQRCSEVEGPATAFAHRMFQHASLELERLWLPRFSQILAASEKEAAIARTFAGSARVSVYPNAIPWRATTSRNTDEAIVFSGNMEYHPNRSAVRFFRTEVWPILRERWPQLVWRLVGKNPEAVCQFTTGDLRIKVDGPVDDAIEAISAARVAVAPILAGSGTRLKILEAWAAGVPVVSTTLGAEGLGARDGEHLLLAESGPAFAQSVSQLLECEELRRKLSTAAKVLLETEFTWEAAWKTLDF